MKSEEELISASTKYRYRENKLLNQIPEFVAFKEQYKSVVSLEKILEVKKIYPHGVIGKNESGKVIVMDRIGSLKLAEIAKYFDDDTFIAYTFQRLLYLSEKILKEKEQIIWIIDLSGKIMQLASKKTYGILEKIILGAQKYFPGILYKEMFCHHRLYFVNTPMLFDAIWSKISEGIDNNTLDKTIHLSDDIEEILTEVDLSILPKCLGGAQSDNILMEKEANLQKSKQIEEEEQEQENETQEVDFTSLKMALSNLKLGSSHNQSVSNTPLNTEADDSSI